VETGAEEGIAALRVILDAVAADAGAPLRERVAS
jgi:hypothetical protein